MWAGLACVSLADEVVQRPIVVYLYSSIRDIPDKSRVRGLRLIVQAFSELGYEVKFEHQPPKRTVTNLDQSKIDVLCLRVEGMERLNPNILRVPVSVHKMKLYGYVEPSKRPVSGLWRDASLESVSISHGAQDPSRYIPVLLQKKLVRTQSNLTGARMAGLGRLDMAIVPEIIFHAAERKEKEVFSHLVKLEPEIASMDTYCFINALQSYLFEPLSAALRRLKLQDPWQFDDSRYPMVLTEKEMTKLRNTPHFSQKSF